MLIRQRIGNQMISTQLLPTMPVGAMTVRTEDTMVLVAPMEESAVQIKWLKPTPGQFLLNSWAAQFWTQCLLPVPGERSGVALTVILGHRVNTLVQVMSVAISVSLYQQTNGHSTLLAADYLHELTWSNRSGLIVSGDDQGISAVLGTTPQDTFSLANGQASIKVLINYSRQVLALGRLAAPVQAKSPVAAVILSTPTRFTTWLDTPAATILLYLSQGNASITVTAGTSDHPSVSADTAWLLAGLPQTAVQVLGKGLFLTDLWINGSALLTGSSALPYWSTTVPVSQGHLTRICAAQDEWRWHGCLDTPQPLLFWQQMAQQLRISDEQNFRALVKLRSAALAGRHSLTNH